MGAIVGPPQSPCNGRIRERTTRLALEVRVQDNDLIIVTRLAVGDLVLPMPGGK
jgi:hypothetical protein